MRHAASAVPHTFNERWTQRPRDSLHSWRSTSPYFTTIAGDEARARIHVRDRMAGKRDFSIFQLVQERIPVPHVHYTTMGSEPGAMSYTVMRWIDGILFSDILASKDETTIAACAREIGITLANIGTYTFPKAGFFGPDLTIIEEFDEGSTLSYFEQFLFTGQSGQHLGPTLTRRLWNFLKDNAHYFDAISAARSLVHSDFKGFNILVHQLNDRWKVSAVLDWEFAFAGSPLVDIGNMLRYSHLHPAIFEQEFINGYQEQGGMLPLDWKKIAKLVDLLSLYEFLNSPIPRRALRQEFSGSGKTTVARLLARLYEPTAGTMLFRGKPVSTGKMASLRSYRHHVRLVFQDPFSSLNPVHDVRYHLSRRHARVFPAARPARCPDYNKPGLWLGANSGWENALTRLSSNAILFVDKTWLLSSDTACRFFWYRRRNPCLVSCRA